MVWIEMWECKDNKFYISGLAIRLSRNIKDMAKTKKVRVHKQLYLILHVIMIQNSHRSVSWKMLWSLLSSNVEDTSTILLRNRANNQFGPSTWRHSQVSAIYKIYLKLSTWRWFIVHIRFRFFKGNASHLIVSLTERKRSNV